MNWLKRLFCRHDWHFIKHTDFWWTLYECNKCGKQKDIVKWEQIMNDQPDTILVDILNEKHEIVDK